MEILNPGSTSESPQAVKCYANVISQNNLEVTIT